MLRVGLTILLCGCATDVLIPPGEGGGGNVPGPSGSTTQQASTGETVGQGGTGGEGGSAQRRTIVVDMEVPEDADPDRVVVLVSAPDGTVNGTWLGGELPVDAPVNDGDLVWYLYERGIASDAHTFRVTKDVTEVRVAPWLGRRFELCDYQPPMTLTLDVPAIDGANVFNLVLSGAKWVPLSSVGPGTTTLEVQVCLEATAFDLLLVAKEYANTDPLGFARIDAIPYVPGSTTSLPITFSDERTLVDIVVEAQPGTPFVAHGDWRNQAFGHAGYEVYTSSGQQVGESGTATMQYGPFALGSGTSSVSVSAPPSWSCELERAWKVVPFDGAPLHVKLGALAGFAPLADGNVAIASDGELGDVLKRTEHEYASDTPSYWALHEDPKTPQPLPVKPAVPEGLLPSFKWPNPSADLEYIHQDATPVDGYADFVRAEAEVMDGRARHRHLETCF